MHEKLTYEIGESKDWEPHKGLLDSSDLMSKLTNEKWFIQLSSDIDKEESTTTSAVKWAVDQLSKVSLQALNEAVRYRAGTYAGTMREDGLNPFYLNYAEIAQSLDSETVSKFREGIQLLNANEIGHMGFMVLVRLGLMGESIVSPGLGNYYPHFSRQPVLVSLDREHKPLETYSMAQVADLREQLLKNTGSVVGPLSKALSPIFLATLNRAKKPMDIIENALSIRESKSAKKFRIEVDQIRKEAVENPEKKELYKARIASRVGDLNDFLFEKGVSETYFRSWRVKASMMPLGWIAGWRKTFRKFDYPGDTSVVFLSDILSQAIGIVSAQKKIEAVFGTPAFYDAHLIPCTTVNRF